VTRRTWAIAVVMAVVAAPVSTQRPSPTAALEVRVYTLKPGVRDAFHARFIRESLPLLQDAGIDVVAFGPSQHDRDSYFLLRLFPSVAERERAEERFYASRAWLDGPRAAVLAAIDTYSTALLTVDATTLKGLRTMPTTPSTAAPAANDLATLTRLNDDYIDAVRTSNVQRFREILSDDFLCTLADGTLLDRDQFLLQAARPTTALGLQAHDVNVRLLGETAIVHAATTFSHPDGRPGRGRYTDVWARRDGRWVAVAAQFSRQ
jgi:ketosteroid isomerase-like protein